MKSIILIGLMLFSFGAVAQNGKVTFTTEFKNISEGYDHLSKEKIFVNGILVFTSEEHAESEILTAKIKLPRGTQNIRIENWTLYNGTWELTEMNNGYSIDGFYESELTLGKKNELYIIYDLDDQNSPHVTFKKIR